MRCVNGSIQCRLGVVEGVDPEAVHFAVDGVEDFACLDGVGGGDALVVSIVCFVLGLRASVNNLVDEC